MGGRYLCVGGRGRGGVEGKLAVHGAVLEAMYVGGVVRAVGCVVSVRGVVVGDKVWGGVR